MTPSTDGQMDVQMDNVKLLLPPSTSLSRGYDDIDSQYIRVPNDQMIRIVHSTDMLPNGQAMSVFCKQFWKKKLP